MHGSTVVGVNAYERRSFMTSTNVVIDSLNVAFSARFLRESLKRATLTKLCPRVRVTQGAEEERGEGVKTRYEGECS